MFIIGRTTNYHDELILAHDGMRFSALQSAIVSPECNIIGAYVDCSGNPHLVRRRSDYGVLIVDAFQDSRKWNPSGWAIRDLTSNDKEEEE